MSLAPNRRPGPELEPASGEAAKQLVVLIHGFGSNGADLIALAPAWRQALPDAAFVAPDAPEATPWGGYQWWPLADLSPAGLAAGALAAAPAFDRFLDATLERHGLDEEKLLLVGFSQGTMMALHIAPRRPRAVAGVIGYSGMLADAGMLAAEARHRVSVLLIHGDADSVVPVRALETSAATLRTLGFPVETHVTPGLGHGVDAGGIGLGGAFARRVLGV